MKKQGACLIRNKQNQSPQIQETRQEISRATLGQTQIYGFTDGSSRSREKAPNSGIGIVIYDSDKKLLWEGGLGIRTDGNNYVAELAAAAILLCSTPEETKLTH